MALLYMPPMTLLQPTDFCCSKAFYSILWEIMSLSSLLLLLLLLLLLFHIQTDTSSRYNHQLFSSKPQNYQTEELFYVTKWQSCLLTCVCLLAKLKAIAESKWYTHNNKNSAKQYNEVITKPSGYVVAYFVHMYMYYKKFKSVWYQIS